MADRDDDETRRELGAWVAELALALEAEEAPVDIDAILGMAGIAAHAVLRPAAPLTTYLLGYVAGRSGTDSAGAVEAAAATVRRLVAERDPSPRE